MLVMSSVHWHPCLRLYRLLVDGAHISRSVCTIRVLDALFAIEDHTLMVCNSVSGHILQRRDFE